MHRFSQADQEGAGAGNVFDLGGDLGQWRIDSIEVDPETTRPSDHTILGLSGAVFKSRLSPRTTEHRGRGVRGDKLHLEAPVQQGAQAGVCVLGQPQGVRA